MMKCITLNRALAAVAVMLAIILLQACETRPTRLPELKPARLEIAERAEKNGEYVLAAREYDRLAQDALAPQKQNYQLKTVDALIKAAQIHEARQKITVINVARLDPSYSARKQILQARLASFEGEHVRAIHLLNKAQRTRGLDPSLMSEIYVTRGDDEFASPLGWLVHRPVMQVAETTTAAGFVFFGQFTSDHRLAIAAEGGRHITQRLKNAMRTFVINLRSCFHFSFFEKFPPRRRFGRREPLKDKPVSRQAGDRKRGDGGACAGHGFDRYALGPSGANQLIAGGSCVKRTGSVVCCCHANRQP